ncbi:MAG: sigma-70 family RNA polymerase sigma factor [Candidatus Doudnabacteria bacterium]|nr:sigma-70 family RNA polymerase sigma factor [Candidatus Doudnabacteria bacterium]
METNLAQIIAECQAGQLEQFAVLYDAYVRKIYDFIFYRTMHKETAEDLTSLTFTKALERINTYQANKGSFSAWLYQIARNTLIDNYKNHKPTAAVEELENFASGENLEQQTEARLNLEKVKNFLQTLDEEKREIVTMRVWDGLSYKEIGDILGKSESSCKMSFLRIMEKLNKEAAFALIYLLMLKIG